MMRSLLKYIPFSRWYWADLFEQFEAEFPGRCAICSYCRFDCWRRPPLHPCKEHGGDSWPPPAMGKAVEE